MKIENWRRALAYGLVLFLCYDSHVICVKLWMEKGPGKSAVAKNGKLVIMVDEAELEEMRDTAKEMGFRNVGDFVMGCWRFAKESRNHHA